MSRRALYLLLALALSETAYAAKCGPPDPNKLAWTRKISLSSLPKGVEVFDRVWLTNPTSTELILFTPEKDAEKRTGYREILGSVPTSKDELPRTKLVNGERYEFHFPENPTFTEEGKAMRGGWVRHDYPAGLIEPKKPVVPPTLENRIFIGKTKALGVKVPIPYYFGKKRGVIDLVYEFTANPRYGKVAEGCPMPTPEPSP